MDEGQVFQYDVFLSHSSKDKAVVRAIAERLKSDGITVWFDEWEIKPGDSIPAKVEDGLERSHVLVFCMSENAFGSEWARLESYTFRFKDPMNKKRRFIPLRLDDAPIKGSLEQFLYISWRHYDREQEYPKILDACRTPRSENPLNKEKTTESKSKKVFSLGHSNLVQSVAISPDGRQAMSGSADHTVRLWDVESGRCLRVLLGHTYAVLSVVWSPDGRRALSGSFDNTVRLWDIESGRCLHIFKDHTFPVFSVAWSPDGRYALSGSEDKTVRLWDVESGRCLRVLEGHSKIVFSVAWSPDGRRALSGSADKTVRLWDVESGLCLAVLEAHSDGVYSVAWSPDGRQALTGSLDKTVRLWDIESGKCLRVLKDHVGMILSVVWCPDSRHALSGSEDKTVRLWDVESGLCLRILKDHSDRICVLALSSDGRRALSGSADNSLRLWSVESGTCLRVLEGHFASVCSVDWNIDGRRALSGSADKTVRVWDLETGLCLKVFEDHSASVHSVAWSPDGRQALSGSTDKTVRLWDVESGRCLRVLEGHVGTILSVAWNPGGHLALSGSEDKTVRLWDVESGLCLNVLQSESDSVCSVTWFPDAFRALSGSVDGVMRVWDFWLPDSESRAPKERTMDQVQYTNAKVLIVGDSGVGKTGLSNYLAHGIKVEEDKPLSSTDGAWATQWLLPSAKKQTRVEREIWLWDFAGQVDYRLVHQLFMDDTAAAVLVFNPQSENPFEGLGQWDRDLQKAARKPFAKLLAAGRIDRGSLVVNSASVERFIKERGFTHQLYETSAKTGAGCDKLRDAIVKAIDWKTIPEMTSPVIYRRLKQEILGLRDSGLVLIRLSELKQRMELTLLKEQFKLQELQTVIDLLSGPGMIQNVDFGGFILLRPEVLSRYAAALVRKVRQHPQELGCIREDELLAGNLDYQDFQRLPRADEEVVLRTLLDTVVSRAWCIRQPCEGSALLTFPSYFRRERVEQPSHPNVLVTYRFSGPVEDIYATLVVRLHHTMGFETAQLWKDAADFKTLTGQNLGFKFTRETEGAARMEVYFAPDVDINSCVLFLRYVHNHLADYAQNVLRLRNYHCANKNCDARGQPFPNQSNVDKALAPGGRGKVFCPSCGKPIILRDVMERKFDSPAVKEQARQMQEAGQIAIDNESRELMAVHHAGFIVAEAGQIYRSFTNSDHGIDGEIEFKDDNDCATGKRLYLQLKSGDSYLVKRQHDGAEVFHIKKPRWANYWQQQAYPVMLVIRTSDGIIRWMDVSEYLKRASHNQTKPVTQIVFTGETLDALTVRRCRARALKQPGT